MYLILWYIKYSTVRYHCPWCPGLRSPTNPFTILDHVSASDISAPVENHTY